MSLGSSDMAGSALGTAFSLLLLASIIQGLKDVEVLHYEKMEAEVGQDVALPCTVKSGANVQIIGIEWIKNGDKTSKLALYSPEHGLGHILPNVSIETKNNSRLGSLYLSGVTTSDSGTYICLITTFPQGSIRRETELKIKDVEITCDVNSTIEVHAGENVTIQCRKLPHAQYRWTKNTTLVSVNESLVLPWVTDAHTGVYTLTVNTGNKSLHKEFIITVLPASTRLRTDSVTASPQFNVTKERVIQSANSSFESSPTTGLPAIYTTATQSTGTDAANDNLNPSDVTVTAGGQTNYTHISVTSPPATHTDPYHLNTSGDLDIDSNYTLNTSTISDQSLSSNQTTTLSYGGTVFESTQEMRNESVTHSLHPEVKSTTSPEDSSTQRSLMESDPGATLTLNIATLRTFHHEDSDGVQSHLLPVFIIIPVLVLIAVAAFLYRKQMIKRRMDLPPPFKPPPPPIKYTSAVRSEKQHFPTSRCNSVAEPEDFKQMFINI